MTDLDDLAGRLRTFATDRGWERYHSPKNLLMALNGEVGELVSELQWLAEAEADPDSWDEALRSRVTDEFADVLIYLVRFADVCGIDPHKAARAKISRNEGRFPIADSRSDAVPLSRRGVGP